MLLLSQVAAGIFVCLALATLLPGNVFTSIAAPLSVTGFLSLQAGLILSVFHLGRPLKAWRFFLGLRTSWMSREILLFGLFAAASAAVSVTSTFYLPKTKALFTSLANIPVNAIADATPPLAVLAEGTALAAIFCSAMIYADTRRPFWSASLTFPKFFGTTLLLGAGTSAAVLSWMRVADAAPPSVTWLACSAAVVLGVLYAAWEALSFHQSLRSECAPTHRSARTIRDLLSPCCGCVRRLSWRRLLPDLLRCLSGHYRKRSARPLFSCSRSPRGSSSDIAFLPPQMRRACPEGSPRERRVGAHRLTRPPMGRSADGGSRAASRRLRAR